MNRRKGTGLILAGLMMIAAAGVFAGYNLYDGYRAGQAAQEAVRYIEPMLPVETAVPTGAQTETTVQSGLTERETEITASEGEIPAPEIEFPAAEIEIPDYVLNPRMDMPTISYDGQDYIGVLEIPMLELKIPVISEWSYPRLKIAPCRYYGSAYTNDLVIAAHNYEAHFGRINELKEGNTVIFTDVDGNRFMYRVVLKEVLDPEDIEGMTGTDFGLTLFTCTVGGSYRVTIRCNQVSN